MSDLTGTFRVTRVEGALQVDYPTANQQPDYSGTPTFIARWSITLTPVLDAGDPLNQAVWGKRVPSGVLQLDDISADAAAGYPLGAVISLDLAVSSLDNAPVALTPTADLQTPILTQESAQVVG